MTDNQRFESNHLPNEPQYIPNTYPVTPQSPTTLEPVETPKPRKKRYLLKGILLLLFCLLIFLAGVIAAFKYYPQLSSGHAKLSELLYGTKETTANAVQETQSEKSGDKIGKEQAAQRRDLQNLTIPEIVEQNKAGVVAITSDQEIETRYGVMVGHPTGSGFIISPDGYVVTNEHVIHNTKNIRVVLSDGSSISAKLVGSDPLNDLAVLKMEGEGYSPVNLGSSTDLKVGELAVAIGNPSGNLSGTVTAGIISALEREINIQGLDMVLLQTDTAINEGNSGGALFNSRGQVIGINTAKLSLTESGKSVYEGLGFAIPIDTAKPIIDDLIKYGYVKDRAYVGIKGLPAGKQLYVAPNDFGGVYVTEVLPNSPAQAAGIEAGDIIIEFNGVRIREPMDINNEIKKLKPDSEVEVSVYRGEKVSNLTLTLRALEETLKRN